MPRKSTNATSKTRKTNEQLSVAMTAAANEQTSVDELSSILASVGAISPEMPLPEQGAAPNLEGLDAVIAGAGLPEGAQVGDAATFAAPELPALDGAPAPDSALAELGSLLAAEGVDLSLPQTTDAAAAPELPQEATPPAATDPNAPVDKAALRAAADKAKAEQKAKDAAEKAQRRAEREAKKKEAAEKPPAAPKIFFGSNKVGRLQHTLADAIGDYTLFELKDAEGDIAAKSQENLNAMKELGTKVQNRVTYILEFAAGKSKSLNSVIATALSVLSRDGFITTGDKGNLMQALSGKYALTSARAMANNSLLALKFLRMVVPADDKQKLVANADSTLMPVVQAKLGMQPASTPTAETEEAAA